MRLVKIATLLLLVFIAPKFSLAQATPHPAQKDSVREFEIIRGPSMRMIKTDTGTIQTIAGGAIVNQGGTKFFADSMVLNNDTKNMQAFGKIHINDGDTVQIFSDYLQYSGLSRIAVLQRNVRLIGRHGTLHTNQLDYNFETSIGNYYQGGKVTSGKDVITSTEGTYYADTKDVYFKKNVKSDGPKNHIRSDSLVYNMDNGGINFISKSFIKNNELEISTSQGSYDTKTGNAFFATRSVVKDSSGRLYTANSMALDGKSGNAQLEGNGVIIDSANGFILLGNQIFLNRQNNSFLATRKPLLIIKQKNDSTYVAADIIFSGLAKMVNQQLVYLTDSATQLNREQTKKINMLEQDSTGNLLHPADSLNVKSDSLHPEPPAIEDSLQKNKQDIFARLANKPLETDSLKALEKPVTSKTIAENDTSQLKQKILQNDSAKPDSLHQKLNKLQPPDSIKKTKIDSLKDHLKETLISQKDSAGKEKNILQNETENGEVPETNPVAPSIAQEDSLQKPKDSTRYFIAYHHVRIFNDSLQSICDSMFVSSKDSVFRLYYSPVLWSRESQVTGDTMFLFTKNKEANRLYAFDKALVVNKTKEGFFNQMSGKTLNAYFKDNKFDHIRMRGSQSESIYYMQDKDSSYIGMNRASGDVIDMLFANGELQKILMINQVKGTMYPMNKIPPDQDRLKDFQWLEDKRPKNKAELFE